MPSRRQFLAQIPAGILVGGELLDVLPALRLEGAPNAASQADVVIVGAGLGGCSAALAALESGLSVILTETTDWIGGQLTSQAVPPDEHRWIETHGANASYRKLRSAIRDYYRRHYPLTAKAAADPTLNPGLGSVSRLCHEPRVALAVLLEKLNPYLGSGRLRLFTEHDPINATTNGDRVEAVEVLSRRTGHRYWLEAPFFIDGTELGDLLPLTGAEYVTGNEGRNVTGELHAPEKTDPNNHQAFTCCFAMEHRQGENHVISRPASYTGWRDYVPKLNPSWPGKWLDFTYTHPRSGEPKRLGFNPGPGPHGGVVNLWTYRRIAAVQQFAEGRYRSDICLVNWPQNDYLEGSLVDVSDFEWARQVSRAKELSLSLLYWLQTEAPRMDGGTGYPGLRLRSDIVGTEDGIAKYPYIRESRRIRAKFTVTESHCGLDQRRLETGLKGDDLKAVSFTDSVAIGSYPIDLHPSTGGDNYIDFETLPFQVPLGALIPARMENLLPANKNIGTTHVTNGCYRLHPVEWGIGEAVGTLVAFCHQQKTTPAAVWEQKPRTAQLQKMLRDRQCELEW